MKPPAFRFYADDFMAGTMDMSQDEVGAYIRLLCHQWNRGSIPVEPERQQRLAGGSVSVHVLAKFKVCDDGLLRNERMEAERLKQDEYRQKQAEKGRKSGLARAAVEPVLNHGSDSVQTQHEPETNLPFPLPFSKDTKGQTEMPIANPDPLDIPKELHSPEFSTAWQKWMTFRRGMGKKPKNWAMMFYEQLQWLKQFGPQEASEMIGQSIRNNYQGLFERKSNATNQSANKPSTDRNAGTANAGKASQYRGVGKVGWVPNNGNT